jgi:ABC-type multidrug transport system ATPase subunit
MLDEPALPDMGTVRELMAVTRAIRGERADRQSWFEALGVASLMKTPVRHLDRSQARTVALGMALSIPDVRLLVLYEPLAQVVSADARRLAAVLHERAKEGACVLVLTASAADAAALADDVATLQHGRIGRAIGAPDVDEMVPGMPLELRVWTDKPRQVAAALALEPSAELVWLSTGQKSAPVLIQTRDLEAGARAVARAIEAQGAELYALQTTMPGSAQTHEATLRMLIRGAGEP